MPPEAPDVKTWYATEPFSIESRPFAVGDVLGTGEGKAFKAAEGLGDLVGFGHVKARISYGKVSDVKPEIPIAADDSDNLDGMTVAQMKDYAAEHEIDLGDAKTKDKIRSVIDDAIAADDSDNSDDE